MTVKMKPGLWLGTLILAQSIALGVFTGCGDKYVEDESHAGAIAQRGDVFASELNLIDE
jgi:hypothetical protein